jgi:hypothetical protein
VSLTCRLAGSRIPERAGGKREAKPWTSTPIGKPSILTSIQAGYEKLIQKVKEADFFVRRMLPWDLSAHGSIRSRMGRFPVGFIDGRKSRCFLRLELVPFDASRGKRDHRCRFRRIAHSSNGCDGDDFGHGESVDPPFFFHDSRGPARIRRGAWSSGRWSFLVWPLGILSLTGHQWMGVFFFGFSDKAQNLLVELFRILVWMIPLQAGFGVTQSLAYAQGRFFRAEISALVGSLLALLALVFLFPSMGVKGYAWALVLRVAVSVGGLSGSSWCFSASPFSQGAVAVFAPPYWYTYGRGGHL